MQSYRDHKGRSMDLKPARDYISTTHSRQFHVYRNWHSILCRHDRQSYTWQSLLQYFARQQRLHIFIRDTRMSSLPQLSADREVKVSVSVVSPPESLESPPLVSPLPVLVDAGLRRKEKPRGRRLRCSFVLMAVALKAQRPQRGFQQWLVLSSRSSAD